MKDVIKLLGLLSLAAGSVFAQQSAPEKTKAAAHDVRRQARKSVNRADEAMCTGTKAECDAAKAKHRVGEAKEKVKDDTHELKDKIDRDTR